MQIGAIPSWAGRLGLVGLAGSARPPHRQARRLIRFFSTGMRAAADYRRLEAMTDGQLAAQGLTRADIPGAVFERHFADPESDSSLQSE